GTAISNQLALPVGGMQQLERLKIGPVASKARLFELSESLSNFGPVTIIDETDDHGYFLEVTVIEEDIPEIRLLVE
nr:hypothetical protein [Rhizobiaceae bacterium]